MPGIPTAPGMESSLFTHSHLLPPDPLRVHNQNLCHDARSSSLLSDLRWYLLPAFKLSRLNAALINHPARVISFIPGGQWSMRRLCLSLGRSWCFISSPGINQPWPEHPPNYSRRDPEHLFNLDNLDSHHPLCTRHTRPPETLNPPSACSQIPFWRVVCRGRSSSLDSLPLKEPQSRISLASSLCSNASFATAVTLTLTSQTHSPWR